MKFKWKLMLAIPIVVILAFGLLKAGGNFAKGKGQDDGGTGNSVQTVVVKDVTKVKTENMLSLTGTLAPFDEAAISSKVGGRVSRVAVDNGSSVAAGSGLVYLENTEYKNALDINRAIQQKAQAGLAAARANYRRFSELHKQGAVSDRDFEDITTALALAEADVSSATAAVNSAEETLRNTTISSPIGGVIADRGVKIGQVISPGVPLMKVADISSVFAVVNIAQEDIPQIKPGLKASVTLESHPGRTFEGVVEIVNPVGSESARVFETKIRVNNKDRSLKPGMFAKVTIKTGGQEEVIAVSKDALTDREGLYFVFLAQDGKAERKQVQIGRIIDQLVEIKGGLTPGQRVIITNVNKLKDQDLIKITE